MNSMPQGFRFAGASKYILDPELVKIVNISMALEMPLLLKGEPGTGKTMFAHAIAEALPLNEAFSPTKTQVIYAKRVIEVDREAAAAGSGAVALDGKMIDIPIVRRAEKLLTHAEVIARRLAAHG